MSWLCVFVEDLRAILQLLGCNSGSREEELILVHLVLSTALCLGHDIVITRFLALEFLFGALQTRQL